MKQSEKEIAEIEDNESESLDFEDEAIGGMPILMEQSMILECEFCGHSFHNTKMLKKHITDEHEQKLLNEINLLKSKLFCSLSKVQVEERKLQNIHKCKPSCFIYHS